MGTVNILGNGPITFTGTDGAQYSLPLSKIWYSDGAFAIDKDWLSNNNKAGDITGFLSRLLAEGAIQLGDAPPPPPAMVITAAESGALGNNIQISFANIDTKAKTFDITVTEKITYSGITLGNIVSRLGSSNAGAPLGGLVFVSSVAAPTMPGVSPPYIPPFTVVLQGGKDSPSPPTSAKVQIPTATVGTSAFELTAKKPGIDSSLIQVTISDVTSTDFTITCFWQKIATGIKVDALQSNFNYRINFAPPPGGMLNLPMAGVVALTGGADTPPKNASATVSVAAL